MAAALAAAAALHIAGPARAAPVGPVQNAITTERAALQEVDYRPYRHCHRNRWGRKWCHGGRRHGYYNYGPSVGLYFGRRHHHHRHFRRHHHRGHHHHRR